MNKVPEAQTPSPFLGRSLPLLAGVVAFLVYLLTVSRGVYPGPSASLTASAAQLIPERLSSHPCWSLITRWLAQAPMLDLPLRLNIFSALCGAIAVALLGTLVAHLIYQAAHEGPDGRKTAMLPTAAADEQNALKTVTVASGVTKYNQLASLAAQLGGCAAALAFAFCVPFWSAATRLHYQASDVLMLLVVLHLVLRDGAKIRPVPTLTAAFLCGIGCVESEIFIPVTTLLAIWLPFRLVHRNRAWERMLGAASLSCALGVAVGLLALHGLLASPPAVPMRLRSLCVGLLRTHISAFRNCLPPVGWIWIIVLAFVPAIIILPKAWVSFVNRLSIPRAILHLLFTFATMLCLFNAPFSPWGMARESGYLPVMAYLAVASVAGYLVAYWRLLYAPDDTVAGNRSKTQLSDGWRRWAGNGMGWTLLAVVCVSPILNLREADGRQGAFADAIARDVLAQDGGRDWVVGDGLLDNHLLVAASTEGRNLHLLSLTTGDYPQRLRQLQAWIGVEPAFADIRPRLSEAAALGPQAFVAAWLMNASSAESRLAFMGTAAMWKRAGWCSVPNGLGYCGTRHMEYLRSLDPLASNRVFWARMSVTLAPVGGAPPIVDRLRRALRQRISRTANDLGVLLQDLGRDEDACEAYGVARRFDPDNLSALFNQYFLAERGVRANEKPALEEALRTRLAEPLPPVSDIIDVYGEIRQADALAKESRAWLRRGQTSIASAELIRALALSPGNTNAQRELAAFCLSQGDAAGSERAFRALLAANPADTKAMLGLITLALTGGRADDVRDWLARARQAGASEDELRLATASLMMMTGASDAALASLQAATDRHPDDITVWSMLADVLLRRNAIGDVEQQVLPAMIKAAGENDNALIYVVRAQVLARKKPVDFAGARNAYLRALILRPDLVGIRNDLLSLDQRSGNTTFMECDAANAIRADPDDALANYVLGAALLAGNDLPRAEAHFRRSLATSKTLAALNDLAETLRRQRRGTEAEKCAREVLALNADFYPGWDTLANVLLDAHRLDDAGQAVAQALKLCATDPRLHLTLARIRLAQGRPGEARQIWQAAMEKFRDQAHGIRQEFAELGRSIDAATATARH